MMKKDHHHEKYKIYFKKYIFHHHQYCLEVSIILKITIRIKKAIFTYDKQKNPKMIFKLIIKAYFPRYVKSRAVVSVQKQSTSTI